MILEVQLRRNHGQAMEILYKGETHTIDKPYVRFRVDSFEELEQILKDNEGKISTKRSVQMTLFDDNFEPIGVPPHEVKVISVKMPSEDEIKEVFYEYLDSAYSEDYYKDMENIFEAGIYYGIHGKLPEHE